MRHHIIHHNDLDGYASAAVIALYSPRGQSVTFHEVDYGSPDPGGIDFSCDAVTVVDFTFSPASRMESYARRLGDRFVWIDHHASSMVLQQESELLRNVRGERFCGEAEGIPLAACELAWKYCEPDYPIPVLLRWIGDWDAWRHAIKGNTSDVWAFMVEMDGRSRTPRTHLEWWRRMLLVTKDEIVERHIREVVIPHGRGYVDFIREQNSTLLRKQGFEATLVVGKNEFRVIAANCDGGKLTFIDYFDPDRHDAMLKFYWVGMDKMTVGLYSDNPRKVDCSEICRILGQQGPIPSGGGHAGAGGFLTTWEHFNTIIYDVRCLSGQKG